jgi:murein L,D-transpeptidase YcbB/YkuD
VSATNNQNSGFKKYSPLKPVLFVLLAQVVTPLAHAQYTPAYGSSAASTVPESIDPNATAQATDGMALVQKGPGRVVPLPNFPTAPANTLPPPPTKSIYVTQPAPIIHLPAIKSAAPTVSAVITPLIQSKLGESDYLVTIGDAVVEPSVVLPLYKLRAFAPVFVSETGITPLAEQAKQMFFVQGPASGLGTGDYWSSEIEKRWSSKDPAILAQLDLLLTQSLLRFAMDISIGRVKPQSVDSTISAGKSNTAFATRKFASYQMINNAINEGTQLGQRVAQLEPTVEQYRRLKTFLNALTQLKAHAGWTKVSGAVVLRPGMSSPDVPIIRDHLISLGFMDPSMASPSVEYDDYLLQAVKRWQTESKLGLDGIVGPQSFRAMNLNLDERIMQVRATMDKWRWMPANIGTRYIFVNTAFQELNVYENSQITLSMNVVNGMKDRPTPMFRSAIDSVVLNPYWNPPDNNILKDIMPAQRRDPQHMAKEHIQLFRFAKDPITHQFVLDANGAKTLEEVDPASVKWNKYVDVKPPLIFRQATGPDNSLGIVKFNLRNSSGIYLHDTVHRDLFKQVVRLESSGCIRLERPLDLLDYLLVTPGTISSGQQVTPQNARVVMTQPDTYANTVVRISRSIDVYVVYMSTWVDDYGQVRMAEDKYTYGQDKRVVGAMKSIVPGQQ